MAAMKYYYDLMSQPCRALYIFLKMTKIPFEACPVALRKGEHFSEDFEKINPMKKVPVIIHNDFRLTESIAIFRYFTREFNVADHWYPKDSKAMAQIDEFLEWQHLNLRTHGSMLFLHKTVIPMMKQREPDQKKLSYYQEELDKTLDKMERMFLEKTPYLNRQEISIADLIGVCEVEQPITAGFDVVSHRPITKAWMERVKNETQPFYDEAHQVNKRLKEKLSKSSL